MQKLGDRAGPVGAGLHAAVRCGPGLQGDLPVASGGPIPAVVLSTDPGRGLDLVPGTRPHRKETTP